MYFQVASGTVKQITPDDQAGAASLYPISGADPGAPSNVNASTGSSTNTVSWSAATGTFFAYEIERSTQGCGGTFVSVGTVASTSVSFVDNNFSSTLPGGTYCYRIKALGVGGDSPYATQSAGGGGASCSGGTTSIWSTSTTPGRQLIRTPTTTSWA